MRTGIRILYIEDNALNLRLIQKMLVSRGYEVLSALSGQSGIEMVRKERPNMVLLDIHLPDMSGYDVAQQLKTDIELSSMPVVAITADASPTSRDACLNAGCDDYLGKPILRSELMDVISRNCIIDRYDQ